MRGETDASDFDGVSIVVRALQPGAYYLFVRTGNTRMPWSYYSAPLDLGEGWAKIDVPWTAFEGNWVLGDLNPERIRSISVVAYGDAMTADIAFSSIGLYAGSTAAPARGQHHDGGPGRERVVER